MNKPRLILITLMFVLQFSIDGSSALAGEKSSVLNTPPPLSDAPSNSAPVSPPIDIHIDESENYDSVAAYNSKHAEYLVIWVDPVNTDYEYGIYGRRVDNNGKTLGAAFPIMSLKDKTFINPNVVYIPKYDKYWVTFTESKDGTKLIWAKSINWKGDTQSQFMITSGTEDACCSAIAYNSQDDQVLIVYERSTSDSESVIQTECVEAKLGGECGGGLVTATSGKKLEMPDVVFNLVRNEYLIAYTLASSINDIKGKRCKSDMSWCSDEISITPTGNPKQDSVALAAGLDEYLAVWHENYGTGIDKIWGRRIGGDGTLHSFMQITQGSGKQALGPRVAFGDSGRYLVVSHNGTDIFGRFIPSAKDTPEGDEFYIDKSIILAYGRLGAVCGFSAPCLVAHSEVNQKSGISDIKGRFVGYWNRIYLPVAYRR